MKNNIVKPFGVGYKIVMYMELISNVCFRNHTLITYNLQISSESILNPNKYSNQSYKRETHHTYILESLLGAPPVTFATRRRASSAFKSFNWASRSGFDLFLSSWTLILAAFSPKTQNKPPKLHQIYEAKSTNYSSLPN